MRNVRIRLLQRNFSDGLALSSARVTEQYIRSFTYRPMEPSEAARLINNSRCLRSPLGQSVHSYDGSIDFCDCKKNRPRTGKFLIHVAVDV